MRDSSCTRRGDVSHPRQYRRSAWASSTAGASARAARRRCEPGTARASSARAAATSPGRIRCRARRRVIERDGRVLLGRRALRPGRGAVGPARRLPRRARAPARRPAPGAPRGDGPDRRADGVPRHLDAAVRRPHRPQPDVARASDGRRRARRRRPRRAALVRPRPSCRRRTSSPSRPTSRSSQPGARGTSTRSAAARPGTRAASASRAGSPSIAARSEALARVDRELGAAPLVPGHTPEAVRDVEVQLSLVQALPLADREEVEAVGVAGDEDDARRDRLAVDREPLLAAVLPGDEEQRPQAGEQLAAAPVPLATVDEERVEAERDVVQEEAVADAADVDAPLLAVERGRARRSGRRGRARGRARSGCACRTGCRRTAGRARSRLPRPPRASRRRRPCPARPPRPRGRRPAGRRRRRARARRCRALGGRAELVGARRIAARAWIEDQDSPHSKMRPGAPPDGPFGPCTRQIECRSFEAR